eukprot:TRINITY_DN6850_c0_g1_i2.p1 TRINITY_DN6850_c0_g1~~TRINITY_DN6850_c0_g1_i2.p1  ORF type:complete len:268 (-),score=59.55 TRINITY_DN6850_c0_g1_i2:349-1152(-)
MLVKAGKIDVVITVTTSILTTMFGPLNEGIEELEQMLHNFDNPDMEVIYIFYSGGGSLFYPTLRSQQPSFPPCAASYYIFDSSPVPLSVRAFGLWGADKVGPLGWLLVPPIFLYLYVLEYDRIIDYNEFIAKERHPPVSLFLTSHADPLVPSDSIEYIVRHRNESRAKSAHVHFFLASPHLDHHLIYPDEYQEVIEDFLNIPWKTVSPSVIMDREGCCHRVPGRKEKEVDEEKVTEGKDNEHGEKNGEKEVTEGKENQGAQKNETEG